MKFLIAAVLLCSVNAYACPNLSGSFNCKYRNTISLRSIIMTDVGYIINADGVEQVYKIDGSITSIPDNDNLKDGKYSSVCENDKLIINFSGTLMDEGTEVAREVQKTVYQMKGEQLNILIKTKAKHVPLPTVNFLCTKV